MIFHIFICIIHLLRVYHELTKRSAPRGLDSSVGRALRRYRRGHGFESHSGLNFFQALISQLLKLCVWLRWSVINLLVVNVYHFHFHKLNNQPTKIWFISRNTATIACNKKWKSRRAILFHAHKFTWKSGDHKNSNDVKQEISNVRGSNYRQQTK